MTVADVRRWLHAPADESWRHLAACRGEDPRLWFPNEDNQRHYDKTVRALTKTARAICNRCPVQDDCLEYAIEIDERWGMWGGLTEQERYKITGRRP